MTFLPVSKNAQVINKLLSSKGVLKCAVAFIGKDAEKRFVNAADGAQIICNLDSGSCDPRSVRQLRERHEVKKLPDLHAKVYWTKNEAVVTSANLSMNALGASEQKERLNEAGVLLRDAEHLNAIREWFDSLWVVAEEIHEKDLVLAQKLFDARRKASAELKKTKRVMRTALANKSLLTAAMEKPDMFSSTFVVITWIDMSKAGQRESEKIEDAKKEEGIEVSCYEGWDDLPTGNIIDFTCVDKSGAEPEFGGTWISPQKRLILSVKGGKDSLVVVTATSEPKIFSIKNDSYALSVADIRALKRAVPEIIQAFLKKGDSAVSARLSDIVRKPLLINKMRKN